MISHLGATPLTTEEQCPSRLTQSQHTPDECSPVTAASMRPRVELKYSVILQQSVKHYLLCRKLYSDRLFDIDFRHELSTNPNRSDLHTINHRPSDENRSVFDNW